MYIPMEMPKYTEELSINQLGFASVPYLDGKPLNCSIDKDKVIAKFECKDGTCFILILIPEKKEEIPKIEVPPPPKNW